MKRLPFLQEAVRANPNNEYSWYNLAWAQYLTGDAVASTESIASALRISPGNPIIKQGKEMMEKGEVPEAPESSEVLNEKHFLLFRKLTLDKVSQLTEVFEFMVSSFTWRSRFRFSVDPSCFESQPTSWWNIIPEP